MSGTTVTENKGGYVIVFYGQEVTFTDVTASDNTSTIGSSMANQGGGVLCFRPNSSGGVANLTRLIAHDNKAENTYGGALLFSPSGKSHTMTVALNECEFYNNTAKRGGAIAVTYLGNPTVTIKDTLIHDNVSGIFNNVVGGGLYVGLFSPSTIINLTGNTHIYNNKASTNTLTGLYSVDIGLTSDKVVKSGYYAPTFDKFTGKHATLNVESQVLQPYTAADGFVYTLKANQGIQEMRYNGTTSNTKNNYYWPIGYSCTVTEPASIYYGGEHSGSNAVVKETLKEAIAEAKNGTNVVYVFKTVELTEDVAKLLNESGVTFARCDKHHDSSLFTLSGNADVTLTNAHIDGKGVESDSALINVAGGTLTITEKAIIENGKNTSKDGEGGGIYISRGTLKMTGGTVRNNYAAHKGGGIYARDSSKVYFEGGLVSGNTSDGDGSGALIQLNSTAKFGVGEKAGSTTFDGNTADCQGGAVYIQTGHDHEINRAVFTNNTAKSGYADIGGGAVYIDKQTTVRMQNVYVAENTDSSFALTPRAAVCVCPTGNLAVFELNGLLAVNNKSGADIGTSPLAFDVTPPVIYLPTCVAGGQVTYKTIDKTNNQVLTAAEYQPYRVADRGLLFVKTTASSQTIQWTKGRAEKEGVVFSDNHSNNLYGSAIMTNGQLIIGEETQELTVAKKWNDNRDHSQDQILVYLTHNGEIVDKETRPKDAYVILCEENGWSYTWLELDRAADWSVVEASVSGYSPEVQVEDVVQDSKLSAIASKDTHYLATITNTPGGPNNTLVIHKTALGSKDPDASYQFTLTLEIPEGYEDTAYALKVGEELFPIYQNPVTFSLKHDETAIIEGLPDGFTYKLDEAKDEGHYTTTMYDSVTANEGGAGNIYTVEVVNACFEPKTVTVPIHKTLEGREVQPDDYFRFEIIECKENLESGAAKPSHDIICLHIGAEADELESTINAGEKDIVVVNGVKKTIQHVAGADAAFLLEGFTLPGEYHYTVHELPNDQFPGVSIDPTRYHVIVDVQMDEATEELSANISDIWTKDSDEADWNKDQALTTPLQFTNRFQAQSVKRYFETQKTLVNGHLQPGQFSFLLEEQGVLPWSEDYEGGTKSEIAETLSKQEGWTERELPVSLRTTNGDSGLVQFAGITYGPADAGETPASGVVYAYTLREEIPEGAVQNGDGNWVYNNIIYSGDVKHVYVRVFTTAETIEGENVQVVNASVYSTSEGNGGGAEDGEVYYISGFTNTLIPPAGSLTVVKTWSGDTEAQRPASVTVQLLRNGEAYAAAELSAANGWTHTWEELAEDAEWTAAELNVPEGYTSSVSVSGDGLVVTITNTRTPDNPYTPTPGGNDDDDDDRTDDTPPPEPEQPDIPVLPELPNPNEPDSPDVVTILEDDIPTTYVKVQDPETEEFVYIPEDEIPLQGLEVPQTGNSSRTALWSFLSTASLLGAAGFGLTGRKRKKDRE